MRKLPRKITVQRSFRIEESLIERLEKLSTVLGRSQNDLTNEAIRQLVKDNRDWFASWYIVDDLNEHFERDEELPITLDYKTLVLTVDRAGADGSWFVKYKIADGGGVYDEGIMRESKEKPIDQILIDLSESATIDRAQLDEYLDDMVNV